MKPVSVTQFKGQQEQSVLCVLSLGVRPSEVLGFRLQAFTVSAEFNRNQCPEPV